MRQQPIQHSTPILFGGRASVQCGHNPLRFQFATASPGDEATRLNQVNEPVYEGIKPWPFHRLSKADADLEHEFLKLAYAQLFALPTVQARQFSGGRYLFEHQGIRVNVKVFPAGHIGAFACDQNQAFPTTPSLYKSV
jgi:hypothetical protein